MGLPHGCATSADTAFAKRYGQEQVYKTTNSTTLIYLPIVNGTYMQLSAVYGDCTACTAYLEGMVSCEINKIFTAIQEYMSINARISCMFTLKKHIKEIPQFLEELKKFPIAGLHLQKSNREPDSEYYMISGILKVPNPVINSYVSHTTDFPKGHNNNDITKINEINKQFGLPLF